MVAEKGTLTLRDIQLGLFTLTEQERSTVQQAMVPVYVRTARQLMQEPGGSIGAIVPSRQRRRTQTNKGKQATG